MTSFREPNLFSRLAPAVPVILFAPWVFFVFVLITLIWFLTPFQLRRHKKQAKRSVLITVVWWCSFCQLDCNRAPETDFLTCYVERAFALLLDAFPLVAAGWLQIPGTHIFILRSLDRSLQRPSKSSAMNAVCSPPFSCASSNHFPPTNNFSKLLIIS